MHDTVFKEIEEEFDKLKMQNEHAPSGGTGDSNAGSASKKNQILDEIVRFFLNEMIPLAKVESPHLKRLMLGE